MNESNSGARMDDTLHCPLLLSSSFATRSASRFPVLLRRQCKIRQQMEARCTDMDAQSFGFFGTRARKRCKLLNNILKPLSGNCLIPEFFLQKLNKVGEPTQRSGME